jgi:hypothetical protein
MIDFLDRIIVVKVYSHQLGKDLRIKVHGNHPKPNLFIVSANQHADNAVAQARPILNVVQPNFEHMYYPPFSPQWCFTYDGKVINKGLRSYSTIRWMMNYA